MPSVSLPIKAEAVFEILVRENADMLTTYLRGAVWRPAAVDDLFQETMLVAWRRLPEYDQTRPFGPWLRGIAARLVMAHARKAKRDLLVCDENVLEYLDRQVQHISQRSGDTWDEKLAALHECIAALPEDHRQAIRLRYLEGQTADRAARLLNCHAGGHQEATAAGPGAAAGLSASQGVAAGVQSMSTPEDTPRRLAGWWTDGNAEPEEPLFPAAFGFEPPDETAGPLPDQARLRAADMQLLHALLLHLNSQEPARRQTRIDRAIQTIRLAPQPTPEQEAETGVCAETTCPGIAKLGDDLHHPPLYSGGARRGSSTIQHPPTPGATDGPRRSQRVRRLVPWAVAASVLIAVASWSYLFSSNSAAAALEQIVQAIDDAVDRTYEISVEPTDDPAKREPLPPGGGADDRPPQDRRSGLDGAILYARGGNQFVLYRSTLGGNVVISGSNGRQNWAVRPNGSVLVGSNRSDFRVPMPENLAAIPFVDIRLSLTNLRHGYQIEELPAETLDDATTPWRHLRTTKLDPATRGPKAVSIWFHPTTHLIGRIRFEQIHLQGRPEPRRMTLSLISHQPLPSDWFDHEAHHAPDTPIERVTP